MILRRLLPKIGLSVISLMIFTTLKAQSLQDRIITATKQFTSDPQMSHALTSLTIIEAQSGQELFNLNAKVGLAPASNLKILTAATAFYLLGTDFSYETKIFYSGTIKKGILNGDLIIRGSGDPTLGSWRYDRTKMKVVLSEWVKTIKEAGIQKIEGSVIGDPSIFESQITPNGWVWQDIGNYYGAGASGLNWHENQYDLHLLPGDRIGDPVKITGTRPLMEQLHFINELKTGSSHSGDRTYIYVAPYGHVAYVRGTAPANHPRFQVSGSVPSPALFCANSLQKALQEDGIPVSGPVTTSRLLELSGEKLPLDLHLLATHTSPDLTKIIHWFLKRSINLYGELLIKTIAFQEENEGSTKKGIEIEKKFWESKGLSPKALHVMDGSGLSPENRITTQALARVLFHVRQQNWYPVYKKCLPVIHNIHMKSGHIDGVASYTGYLRSREGTPLIFSFIVNNYNGSVGSVNRKMFQLLDKIKY